MAERPSSDAPDLTTQSGPLIEVIQTDDHMFAPSAEFVSHSAITDRSLYKQAEQDLTGYWAEQAQSIDWISPWTQVLDDSASAISNAIPQLLADARNRLEAAAFVNGTGSTSPLGAIYSVGAVTASRVATTTSGAFGLVDIYQVWNALPAVARQSAKLGWMAGNATISSIRQFDTTGSAAFWTDLNQATPANLLGAPIYEASEMTTATTSGSDILIVGDWSAFAIVSHIAGASLEYIPAVMGSNQRPTFTSGWQYHHRVGNAVLDESKFRLLRT